MCGLPSHQFTEPSAHCPPQSVRFSLATGGARGVTAAWTSKALASGRAQLAPTWRRRPRKGGVAPGRAHSRVRQALERGDRPRPGGPNTSSVVEDLEERKHHGSGHSDQENSLVVQIAKFVLPACGLVAAN